MDIKPTLKCQYRATLTMLKEAIEVCPEELWTEGTKNRPFWRIAYHTLFYTHWYLMQTAEDVIHWDKDIPDMASLWQPVPDDTVYSRKEILSYWKQVNGLLDLAIDSMDLTASDCGFSWYKVTKLDHQFVNLRHAQQHVGQLSELLMAAGVETKWVGGRRS